MYSDRFNLLALSNYTAGGIPTPQNTFFFIASLHKYPIKTNSLLYDKTHKDKYIPFSILLKANTIVKDCQLLHSLNACLTPKLIPNFVKQNYFQIH